MADDKWAKYATTDSGTGDKWAKYATTVETPDPTKPEPAVGAAQTIKDIIPKEPTIERHRMIPGPGGGFPQDYKMTESEASAAQKKNLGVIGGVLGGELAGPAAGVMAGGRMLPWLMRALATSSGVGAGTGLGEFTGGAKPGEALESAAKTTATGMAMAGGGKVIGDVAGKVFPRVDPTQKINKILGVGMKEITPGKLPASLDEFAVNPARGVIKAGLDESKLAKMDPIERYNAMTKAKDATGKELGKILDMAGKQGKTVDVYAPITKVFSKLDAPEIAKAEKLLQESMGKHGIDLGNLDKLTPAQAQALKQDLWDGGDVGKELYRGIAESIKKAVPEAKDAMRDYGDLLGAEKATRRGAQKFGKEVPESKLRKMFMKHVLPKSAEGAAITGGGIAVYELYKALFGGKGSSFVK